MDDHRYLHVDGVFVGDVPLSVFYLGRRRTRSYTPGPLSERLKRLKRRERQERRSASDANAQRTAQR
jgi:hypothetical protein